MNPQDPVTIDATPTLLPCLARLARQFETEQFDRPGIRFFQTGQYF